MPENIKALIVILIISTAFFSFATPYANKVMDAGSFARRRNLWFILTIVAFLAHNFWLYTLIAIPLVIYANRRELNPAALYFFLMFALPAVPYQIPGIGGMNYFFELTHQRMLALLILLPAFFVLWRQTDHLPFGRNWPDKILLGFVLLCVVLGFLNTTPTDSLRNDFYLFIDIVLPYFVISRSLKNLQSFREAMLSMVLSIMVLAPLGIFETVKHWLLYTPLQEGLTRYLQRNGLLRAVVTTDQSIVLGCVMVVGIGFYLFEQRKIRKKLPRRLGMLLLVAGLIAPFSRGPWVGAAALLVIFLGTGRHSFRRITGMILATIIAFSLVSILPGGEKVINLLPFVGSTDSGNVTYREQLMTNSLIVIKRNPWFGSNDYLDTPELQAMRQGQGIIDIVNTYLQVALAFGLVGLALYVGFFALVILGIYRSMRTIQDVDSDEHLLGRVLLATLISLKIMLVSVSSISFMPQLNWIIAGMGLAYMEMLRKNAAQTGESTGEPGNSGSLSRTG